MLAVKDWCRAKRNERSEVSRLELTDFIKDELKFEDPRPVIEKAMELGILQDSTKPGLAVVI